MLFQTAKSLDIKWNLYNNLNGNDIPNSNDGGGDPKLQNKYYNKSSRRVLSEGEMIGMNRCHFRFIMKE
jgi:hypothetical protein